MTHPDELITLGGLVAAAAAEARTSRPKHIDAKAVDDFVTDLDHRLEGNIADGLRARFPGVAVLGEESIGRDERLPDDAFLIDPLDGTSNWIAGISFCAVSVARIREGRTVTAAVADVYRGYVYTAAFGLGAFKDSRSLRLSSENVPMKLFGLSTGLLERTHRQPESFAKLKAFGRLRNLGAQALQLCLVADGALAFTASYEAKLWDDAAGRLIAAEAGATYTTAVLSAEINHPFTEQKSIAAHPAVAVAVGAIIAPLLAL